MRERIATPSKILRAILSGFLVGVACASYGVAEIGFFVSIAVLLFLVRRFEIRTQILFTVLFAMFFWCSTMVYAAAFPAPDSVAHLPDASYRVEGVIRRASPGEVRQQIILSDILADEEAYSDRVVAYIPAFPSFAYGDRVSLRCNLDAPEPFDGFRYDRWLATKRIYKTCFTHSAPILLERDVGSPFFAFLDDVKGEFIRRIDLVFGEPHGSLLAGLLFGEKRFTDRWDERFIATGTSHIVAASGYNVSIVVAILFAVLTAIGLRRQQAFWLLLVGVFAYVFVAGAEAAVTRAGVMASVVLVARQSGRKSSVLNVLLLSAAGMLAINPFLLRDDAGFQLSFLSTVGLIYASPAIKNKLAFVPETLGLRESLASTLAATLFTLPVVVIGFGAVSIVGPFANLIVLPLIPLAMALGSVAIAVSFISVPLAVVASGPAWATLGFVLLVIKLLAAVPFANIVL